VAMRVRVVAIVAGEHRSRRLRALGDRQRRIAVAVVVVILEERQRLAALRVATVGTWLAAALVHACAAQDRQGEPGPHVLTIVQESRHVVRGSLLATDVALVVVAVAVVPAPVGPELAAVGTVTVSVGRVRLLAGQPDLEPAHERGTAGTAGPEQLAAVPHPAVLDRAIVRADVHVDGAEQRVRGRANEVILGLAVDLGEVEAGARGRAARARSHPVRGLRAEQVDVLLVGRRPARRGAAGGAGLGGRGAAVVIDAVADVGRAGMALGIGVVAIVADRHRARGLGARLHRQRHVAVTVAVVVLEERLRLRARGVIGDPGIGLLPPAAVRLGDAGTGKEDARRGEPQLHGGPGIHELRHVV